MGLHRLKSFRVGVSVLFFALIVFLFVDFRNIVPPSAAGGLLVLQFVPSLLKFVNAAALGAAGFIVIVVLTVLFGRVTCSTVCPLGTLQDVISFMARKKRQRRDYRFSEPQSVLRYSIFTFTVLVLITGSGFLLNLLDPYSSFGRIFSNLIRPIVLVVNNVAAIAFEQLGVHTLYRVRWAVIAPVSPPGSGGIEHFTETCTACHLCVSARPSRVLVPSFLEFGFLGMMQPRMDFLVGHCNYDCTICMNVCPSGALLPLPVEDKKLTQLGVAKFIKENCVVYTDNTDCGACSEHCPTKAVDMVPYANPVNKRLKIPEVKPEYCIGCGGCEHACPTKPYKAIYVDGNPVHKLAKKPVVKKIEEKVDTNDGFPF
jgi:ferredoxin